MVEFGCLSSTQNGTVGLSPADLSRHAYILGGTGSGKSTLIRNLYKHLECANHTGTLKSSAIYIDVKDEDALLFLRQCEKRSIDEGRVTYLDLNRTGFAVNLLELPRHDASYRDGVVSRVVGHVTEMFKEFYSQQQVFVQMERILRLLLFYLYSNTDTPTLIDLYDVISHLQKDKTEMRRIMQVYRNVTGSEMKDALEAAASLPRDAWVPLLNRIEAFATDPYLRSRFSARNSTVDFERMLSPGNITIFRISDTQTPRYAHGLAIMAVIIKIWFAVQERAARVSPDGRPLVVLTLDEFQKVRDLSVVTSILSQARAYNLGLILSHQNLAQISDELLETIVGNTGAQLYGRVSGIDASKIARIIDPHFAKEIASQLAVQPDFVFTAKTLAAPGEQQGLPVQFRMDGPPPLILDESVTGAFIRKMQDEQKVNCSMESELSSVGKKIQWIKQLQAELPPRDQWVVLLFLRKQQGNLREIVLGINSNDRDRTKAVITSLMNLGLVEGMPSGRVGPRTVYRYELSARARDLYFPVSFGSIGSAADIDYVASTAFEHYVSSGFFVGLAIQTARQDRYACDMVAYDYETETAISIEIESVSEAGSHPERVRFNMTKWKELGFSGCHVWSKSGTPEKIRLSMGTDAEGVTVFTV